MKPRYKKLLSVLGAISLVAPFAGCEVDAEETSASETNDSVATTNLQAGAAGAEEGSTGTNVTVTTSEDGTNVTAATVEAGGTNVVVNQQTTVIPKIPATLPTDVTLTKGVQEVVKLLQSGVSETVVLLFVEKSTESFDLHAADLVYLNDIGVPPTILAAMLNHDGADPEVLHSALGTNDVSVAEAPPQVVPGGSNEISNLSAAAPPVEVSSNYVAAPQYGGTVVAQDPNQPVAVDQQPVIVEQQPAVVVTQPAVTYSYFYNSLSPYGSWVFLNDYGWCWQPTIAVTHHGWRPYVHGGRWLYSDVGWYWHSNYSWGWAPFHYGRWYCSPRVGWVWTPDYTWGPSWVTWRRSRDYCGWAPLPPRCSVRPGIGFSYWGRDVGFSFNFGYSHDYYAFVPTRRFCDTRLINHVVPSHRTVNIYKDSTVINNFIVGNNNTIINNGVSRDVIASHTRNEIPRVRVAEASANTARIQPDRLVQKSGEAVVFRPQRPPERLVAAHEAAVARTRSEVARPGGRDTDDPLSTRRNMIASRSTRPDSERLAPEVRASGGTRGASSPSRPVPSRNETARPQVSRGDSDIVRPVFGTPAPLRPEPDRSAEILRSRVTQEARVRPSTGRTQGAVGTGSGSAIPSSRPELIRPNTSRSIAPRFDQGSSSGSDAVLPRGSTRPGAPSVSNGPERLNRPDGSVRNEIGRGGSVLPSNPRGAVQSPATRTETARPTTVLPSGRSVPANPQAASPGFSRPSVTTPETSQRSGLVTRSQLVRPNTPAAQSPAFARPNTSQAPVTRTIPNNSSVQTVRPSASSPAWSRQSAIQQRSSQSPPQPVHRSAPSVQTSPSTARPVQRSESFSRPSMPVQRSAPAPNIVQPQRAAPVRPQSVAPSIAPSQRPTVARPQASMRPTYNPPPVRSAPAYRSAPSRPSASASRPTPQPNGRGRVEIGR